MVQELALELASRHYQTGKPGARYRLVVRCSCRTRMERHSVFRSTRWLTVRCAFCGESELIDLAGPRGVYGRQLTSLNLHLHFDVCPTWLKLASRHLADAQVRAEERKTAWQGDDETAKAKTLEQEFEASMQAIMAAATAIEAFYGVVQKAAEVPQELRDTWRDKKKARQTQVGELLRIAFGISPKDLRPVRNILKNTYMLRNMAVHPKGELAPALLHPELGLGVEGRFYHFRYVHAKQIVDDAHELIYQLVTDGTPKNAEVARYSEDLRAKLVQKGQNEHVQA